LSTILKPREVGKSILSSLYDKVLLSWELDYSSAKFDVRLGSFKDFCATHAILVEQGNNPKDFDRKKSMLRSNEHQMHFIYRRSQDSKAKSLMSHLRNAVAHADFGRRKVGRKFFIYFRHVYQGKLKMTGMIQESLFLEFIEALASAKKS